VRNALVLVAALAACGSDHHNGDGGVGDDGGGDDGSGFDAAIDVPNVKGTVHVQVANAATACAMGVHVVFIDTDNSQQDITADGAGNASADIFPGGSVTAICHRMTSGTPRAEYVMATVLAVEPSDNLVINGAALFLGSQPFDATSGGTFTVNFSANPGATGYDVYWPCSTMATSHTTTTSKAITMQAGCMESPMNIVVVASNGAFTEQNGVAFTNGGSTTITDTWHPLATINSTYTYTNPPAYCTNAGDLDYPCNLDLTRYVPDLRGNGARTMMSTTGAATMLGVSSPPAAYGVMRTIFSSNAAQYQTITHAVDGTLATHTIDLDATLLPWIAPVVYNPATTTLQITATGSNPYDLFKTDLTYVRANTFIFVWHVFGPTAGNFTFPAMPVSFGDVSPKPTDTMSSNHAMVGDSDLIDGYRLARQNVFDSLETCAALVSPTAKRLPVSFNRLSRSN
jgi:hypothetical protein